VQEHRRVCGMIKKTIKRFVWNTQVCDTRRSIGGFRKHRSHHSGADFGTAVPVPAPAPPQPKKPKSGSQNGHSPGQVLRQFFRIETLALNFFSLSS